MSREDIKTYFDVDDKDLDRVLVDLEGKGYVRLVRDKKGIALAKASYEGLGRAFPLDYYKWFPSWIDEGRVF